MNKYGQTALRAVELMHAGLRSPQTAWEHAAAQMFPDSASSRSKSCPKVAFLGLCSAGLIDMLPGPTQVTGADSVNASYARDALELLRSEPNWAAETSSAIWKEVMRRLGADQTKRANGQMDVVLALWTNGLIRR